MRRAFLSLPLLVAFALLKGCGGGDADSSAGGAGTGGGAGVAAGAAGKAGANGGGKAGSGGAGAAGAPLGPPPPAGWHRWDQMPPDCHIYLPDDLSTVAPLTWEACPFQESGCQRIPSPWYTKDSGGFVRLLTVAGPAGDPTLAVARRITTTDEEVLLQQGGAVLAAWRFHIPSSGCVMSVPRPWKNRYVSIVLREAADPSPIVIDWAQGAPFEPPGAVTQHAFGPPQASVLATRIVERDDDAILIEEASGRFSLHDLTTGGTWRPKLGPAVEAYEPALWGRFAVFQSWSPQAASLSVASLDAPGDVVPLLAVPGVKTLWPALGRDGSGHGYLVWSQGSDETAEGVFTKLELWGSPLTAGSVAITPKKLRELPWTSTPLLSTGDGWSAVLGETGEVRLIPWDGSPGRRLPTVPDMPWLGQPGDVVIRDGSVWNLAQGKYPAEGARYIVRFDISSLQPE